MINLDNQVIELICPRCDFYNQIFFKQARMRDVIICRGCKANIQLDDQMNECRKAKIAIQRALAELEDVFQDININIRF